MKAANTAMTISDSLCSLPPGSVEKKIENMTYKFPIPK